MEIKSEGSILCFYEYESKSFHSFYTWFPHRKVEIIMITTFPQIAPCCYSSLGHKETNSLTNLMVDLIPKEEAEYSENRKAPNSTLKSKVC